MKLKNFPPAALSESPWHGSWSWKRGARTCGVVAAGDSGGGWSTEEPWSLVGS